MNLKKIPHRTGYAGEEGAQGCAGAEMVITTECDSQIALPHKMTKITVNRNFIQ